MYAQVRRFSLFTALPKHVPLSVFMFLYYEPQVQECQWGKRHEERLNATEGLALKSNHRAGSLSDTGVPCPRTCGCQVACEAQWYSSALKHNPSTAEYDHAETVLLLTRSNLRHI
jgi:hypothetical protein